MNISRKTIENDTALILETIKKEDADIPSFLSCATPGLVFMSGLTLWQLFIAYPFLDEGKMTRIFSLGSIGFSFFLGFLVFLSLTNLRGKYLSLPQKVKDESIIVGLITKKSAFYACTWLSINVLTGLIIKAFAIEAIFSYVVQFLSLLVIYFIAIVDLGRYDLALLSSAIKQWREGGDVDASLHKP
ncbi:conjugal transfer entry exclusion protein TraS [Aeromonas sp. R9-2]|uniref:conjugal transfer entry exclusion protein TraS n=1 Tax=Aeromonas sp. R9-2 TaxID=3138479 RepID=UPI0034A46A7E